MSFRLGVVLVGLYNVNEKLGTWDADFYLNESWTAALGFTPTTEIVNEVTRQSVWTLRQDPSRRDGSVPS